MSLLHKPSLKPPVHHKPGYKPSDKIYHLLKMVPHLRGGQLVS